MTIDDKNDAVKPDAPAPQPPEPAPPSGGASPSPAPAPAPEPERPLSPVPTEPLYIEVVNDDDNDEPVAPTPAPRPATPKPAAAAPTPAPTPDLRPLVRSTRVEWPLAIAGIAAAVFAAACIAGQTGVMQVVDLANAAHSPPVETSFFDKLVVILRAFVLIPLGAGCLLSGAYFLHLLERRPLGDLRVLGARMLAVVALAILARMLPMPEAITAAKPFYDSLVPLGVMWALMIPTFRLSMRESGIIIGAAMLTLIVLKFGSVIMAFAM